MSEILDKANRRATQREILFCRHCGKTEKEHKTGHYTGEAEDCPGGIAAAWNPIISSATQREARIVTVSTPAKRAHVWQTQDNTSGPWWGGWSIDNFPANLWGNLSFQDRAYRCQHCGMSSRDPRKVTVPCPEDAGFAVPVKKQYNVVDAIMEDKRRLEKMEAARKLNLLLERAKNYKWSAEDRRQHAVSFTYGNLALSNPLVTREMVERAYDRLYAKK